MTLVAEAEAWASRGIEPLFDEYVHAPQQFTIEEVHSLLRAAYGVGYVAALGVNDEPPLPILRSCQFATALRLTLPLSSF